MAINPLQQPINYAVDVQSPFQAALGGIQLGAGLEELDVARQKRAMETQQLQAAQAQQAQFKSGLNAFFAKPPEQRTYEELQPLLVGANKQQFDALKLVGEQMGAEKLGSSKRFTSQVLLALEANPTTAQTMLEERIAAETDPNQKRGFQTILDISKEDPAKAAQFVESLGAGTFGEDWYKGITAVRGERRTAAEAVPKLREAKAKADTAVTDSQLKVQELRAKLEAEPDVARQRQLTTELKAAEVREKEALADKAQIDARYREGEAKDAIKKRAADLGLTTAQTNQALATTRKLGTETQKAALELQAIKDGVGDPKEKFAQEEKIRKEWQGRSKMFGELQGTFNTLEASAKSENGPGDIALITGFMKMLDPGSVVRETEFATARDTAGLFTQLTNRLEKAKNGQLLDNKQRNEYIALSKKYLDSAQAKAAQERKDLGIVVTNYKLNPQNVFGAETAPPQPQPTAEQRRQQAIGQIPTGAAPAAQQRTVTVDY
jgi:ribonuclease HI